MNDDWLLPTPLSGTSLSANRAGIALRANDRGGVSTSSLRSREPLTRFGRLLPSLLPLLEESGTCSAGDASIEVSYNALSVLEAAGSDALDDIVPWSPFAVVIRGRGAIGYEDFRYEYSFFWGRDPVAIERRGFIVRRGERLFRLDSQTFALAEALEAWNRERPDERGVHDALLSFAAVKGLAEGVGAQLDAYLGGQNVLVAPRLGIDLIREPDGTISLAPKLAGVPEAEFRSVFRGIGRADDSYSVTGSDGQEYQIVLDPAQQEALKRVARAQHLSGAAKEHVLQHPEAVFDGVLEAVDIDLSQFSGRVVGIGPLLARPQHRTARTGALDDGPGAGTGPEDSPPDSAPVLDSPAGGPRLVLAELERRKAEGASTVMMGGVETPITEELERKLRLDIESSGEPHPETPSRPRAGGGVVLLIHKDEDGEEYSETAEPRHLLREAQTLPGALMESDSLKPHQREGLAWLLTNLKLGRRGCLLADDMGLGKTLQILTFIAAVLEHDVRAHAEGSLDEQIIVANTDPDLPPWNPVLAVMPLILIENLTWQQDMEKFFHGHGAVFSPLLVLRGAELQRLRTSGSGVETASGQACLDVKRLSQYRLVMTNYETVVNYQFSLGQVPWSLLVTDEAQEYKTPSTKVSHALKALKARFRVASTGTPVETTLDDVWNIFDFLEPTTVLHSLKMFRETFSGPVEAALASGVAPDLGPLRARLGMGTDKARVLRREKSTSVSLPAKHEVVLECTLSPAQRQRHLTVLARKRQGGAGNHPLGLLHELMLVYQHPALLPRFNGAAGADLITACPKLARVIEALREIKVKEQKALVFTRSIPMQQILQSAFRHSFGFDAGIINGRTSRAAEPGSSRETRKRILDRFRSEDGFSILILSPEVAGLGLTITEANHVIHYGRWWNPAKEAQATDRVYRIGQEREVYVYYPVARDPEGTFTTFDERLDALLRRRREVASEFLAPRATEDDLGASLAGEVFGESEAPAAPAVQPGVVVDALDGNEFEALIAAIETRAGRSVILTPKAGDEGIDVISVSSERVRLIQCKRYSAPNAIEEDAVDDLVRGFEAYQARRLKGSRRPIDLVLVTTGAIPRRIRRSLSELNVETIDADRIARLAASVSSADVDSWLARRTGSMAEVQARLSEIL